MEGTVRLKVCNYSRTKPLSRFTTIFLFVQTNGKLLSVCMEIDLSWFDPNIPINWTNFTNIQLSVNSSSVWTMNLFFADPAKGDIYVRPTDLVYLNAPVNSAVGANVQINIIAEYVVICQSMKIYNFPFDSQTCTMTLKYKDRNSERINFVISLAEVVISDGVSSDEWTLDHVKVTMAPGANPEVNNTFSVVFRMHRNSYYYKMTLIYPTLILQLSVACTFLLPSDRGEKITLAATLVIAVYVLQTQMSNLLPQFSSDDTPMVVTAFLVGFALTVLALLESVLIQTVRIYASLVPKSISQLCCRLFDRMRRKESDEPVVLVTSRYVGNTDNPSVTTELVEQVQETGSTDSGSSRDEQLTIATLTALLESKRKLLENQRTESLLENQRVAKRARRDAADRAWRLVEYLLNLVTLVVYTALIIHYFGVYIDWEKNEISQT